MLIGFLIAVSDCEMKKDSKTDTLTRDLLTEESKNETQIAGESSNSTEVEKSKRDKRVIYHIPSYFGETAFVPLLGRWGLAIHSNVGFGGLFGRRRNYYNGYGGYGGSYGGYGQPYSQTWYGQPYYQTSYSPMQYQAVNLGRPAGQCQGEVH
ncbi:unnamed protein product, partial [Mesorhabditis belari]|uniref:Uncharacterized protein n=1 Tax=Mesorhabditis belari TaxID=2138241 RepID=A0AAF3FQH9_9BILA